MLTNRYRALFMSKETRLYRGVADQMLTMIRSGAYPTGGRLPPERELAERYSVSRPTVREAIIALEVQGLVQIKSGSGVYVLPPDNTGGSSNEGIVREGSAFELTEARALLEGEAAALAARMITPDQLRALEQALEDLKDESQDGKLVSELADKHFHQIIADATHNPIIIEMINDLWRTRNKTPSIHNAYQAICEVDSAARYEEHEAIFVAIKARDATVARKAMHNHFERILSKLISAQEAQEFKALKDKTLASRERFSLEQMKMRV